MANIDIEKTIYKNKAGDILPLVRGIYQAESSSNKANTSKPNSSWIIGPMQIGESTFDDMKQRKLIPENYNWRNPQHSTEAGIAYIKYLVDRFNTTDPRIIGPAYYAGPSSIIDKKTGQVKQNISDPRNPDYPTTGQYGEKLYNYIHENYPDFLKSYHATPEGQLPPQPPPPDTHLLDPVHNGIRYVSDAVNNFSDRASDAVDNAVNAVGQSLSSLAINPAIGPAGAIAYPPNYRTGGRVRMI